MKQWIHRFLTGNYNLLLIFLFFLFVFRPYHYHPLYIGAWKTVLTATLIIAIFNCSHRKTTKTVISILAIPTVLLSWVNLFYHDSFVFVAVAVLTVVFMLICTSSIIYDVVIGATVTLETLRGVICAYFLVAFIFAYVYLLQEYIVPGTILIRGQILSLEPHTIYFANTLYFSFVTLLTVGFGDIVPAREWGQTTVVIEGIIGQFYMAILVARLVSVYSIFSHKKLLHILEKEFKNPPL